MKTVVYYMKGQPAQSQQFNSLAEARAFCVAMNKNPECECIRISRN